MELEYCWIIDSQPVQCDSKGDLMFEGGQCVPCDLLPSLVTTFNP